MPRQPKNVARIEQERQETALLAKHGWYNTGKEPWSWTHSSTPWAFYVRADAVSLCRTMK
jgi:hypothetical protein